MCGRYVSPDQAAIERQWHIGRHNNNPFTRHFNIAPTANIPILRSGPDSASLELAEARWGFIPNWWKRDKPPTHTINARSEEAAGKPMWRDAYHHSRCLIPAVGWYEWQAVERPDPRTGKIKTYKYPYFIFPADKRLVCFAGLLSQPGSEGTDVTLTCAILTRDASPSVSEVHDRMPVVLPESALGRWLDPSVSRPEDVEAMVNSARSDFKHYPVSTKLNAAKYDAEDLIEPI